MLFMVVYDSQSDHVVVTGGKVWLSGLTPIS